jgi:hypothetical protein
MALFSGAFDERIALTIAQESGGGGAPAWRVSEFGGDVEKLGATDHNWFKESMFQFSGLNVPKLPYDHHELMAMVAPRALLVTGNTDFFWLSNPSCYVSARATHEVYKTFGIGDRFGFYIDGGHGHCAVPTTQRPAIETFVDKFLLNNTSANTNITVHPYPTLDYQRWYQWWGSGNPVFPDEGSSVKIWLETECGAVGSNWDVLTDATASKGAYVMAKLGLNSTGSAPPNTPENQVAIPFTIEVPGTYNFLARAIGPTATDDSYWVKIDNGPFVSANGLTSSEWQWGRLTIADLTAGPHTLTITYREDGAKLDKVLITTSNVSIITPEFVGPNCGQAPAIAPGQGFRINENATGGSSLGSVLATDPDEGNVLQNWKITGGTGATVFTIDVSTGELTLKDGVSLDFESAASTYDLILTVSDGYFTSTPVTITVDLINENDNVPVINSPQDFVIDNWVADGDIAGVVLAMDMDDKNQPGFTTFQHWQIISGNGDRYFNIDPVTGELIISASLMLNREGDETYGLRISVSDGRFASESEYITIYVSQKVDVCHNGHTINVDRRSASQHLRHGDSPGTCGGNNSSLAGSSATTAEPQPSGNGGYEIFPNPVSHTTQQIVVTLGSNERHVRKVELVEFSTSRVVKNIPVVNESSITIPCVNLSRGMYVLRLLGDSPVTKVIVIE